MKTNNIVLNYSDKFTHEAVLNYQYKRLSNEKFPNAANWKNLLIKGDNLDVLNLLRQQPQIKGRVKLIYIDPPFATNNEFRGDISRTSTISHSLTDEIAYRDNLVGGEFIEFLRRRLILLRELLSDDGSIYLHIDNKMGHYVKVMMDEVFGFNNFRNDITRIKCNPKNFKRKAYGNIKDLILFYTKTGNYIWNEPVIKKSEDDMSKLFKKTDLNGRKYTTIPLHAPGETRNGNTGKMWRNMLPPKGRHWRSSPEELDKLEEQGLIEWSSTGNPRKKVYADESSLKKLQDIWEFKDPPYPKYPTEKNLDMLKLIINTSSNPGDIVLDCFSGSGTTLLAADILNRKWVGIDNSNMAIKVTGKRLEEIKSLYNNFEIVYIE